MLQHNGNIQPSIPTVHFVHMKETYENMDLLLKARSYSKYGWKICGDLKITGLLLEMRSGYTKLCYFLCEWDSQVQDKHYKIKDWPMGGNSVPGEKCVRNQPLVKKGTILLPPLHIKLGLMKNFIKAMNKHGKGFQYLIEKFKKLSDGRLKQRTFIESQNF